MSKATIESFYAAFARLDGAAMQACYAPTSHFEDEVFVLDVYAAREAPMAGVSGASIVEHVSAPVHYVPDFSAVAEQVAAQLPRDVHADAGLALLLFSALTGLFLRRRARRQRVD